MAHEDASTSRTILIVDDEQLIRDMLRRYFELHGFVVSEASDLANTRLALQERRPDAVLLDKNLPDGSGVEFLGELRATGCDSIVFIVTGYRSPDAEQRARQLGADGFVDKPFNLDQLRIELLRAIEAGGAQRREPLVVARLDVEIATADGTHSAHSRNLSVGGMFAETDAPLRVGERVTLRFVLPGEGEHLEINAEVSWVEPGGAGLRFVDLRARDVWNLARLTGK